MSKKMSKNKRILIDAAKVISFALVFVIILQVLSVTVYSKNNATRYTNKFQGAYGFANEVPNSLDIVALGSSNFYSAICPVKLWDDRGYTSTIVASPRQTVSMSYTLLTEILQKQKPKVVLLEAGMLYEGIDLDDDTGKKNKGSRLPAIPYVNDDQLTNDIENYFTVFRLHDNWKLIARNPIKKGNKNKFNHGYYFSNKIKEVTANSNMKYSDASAPIPQDSQIYLNKIALLCKANDIKLVIVTTPTLNEWTYPRHNSVADYAVKNDIDFVDLNTKENFDMNLKKDFRDNGFHVNYYGAKKVTKRLGDFISTTYPDLIEDKRQSPDFSYWYDDKEQFINDNKIKVF